MQDDKPLISEEYFDISSRTIMSLKYDVNKINKMVSGIRNIFKSDGKLLIAGNGGSCADAEHFAGELTCTYNNANRSPFPAISLANTPAVTAWGNDFGYDTYFERQVKALGKSGDCLFLISTGGGDIEKGLSINLINAAKTGIEKGLTVYSLVGKTGGELEKLSDEFIKVKSNTTSHIQECHIAIIHYICECLEGL